MREWGTELWDQLEKVDARFVALSGKNDQLVRFLREKEQVYTWVILLIFYPRKQFDVQFDLSRLVFPEILRCLELN